MSALIGCACSLVVAGMVAACTELPPVENAGGVLGPRELGLVASVREKIVRSSHGNNEVYSSVNVRVQQDVLLARTLKTQPPTIVIDADFVRLAMTTQDPEPVLGLIMGHEFAHLVVDPSTNNAADREMYADLLAVESLIDAGVPVLVAFSRTQNPLVLSVGYLERRFDEKVAVVNQCIINRQFTAACGVATTDAIRACAQIDEMGLRDGHLAELATIRYGFGAIWAPLRLVTCEPKLGQLRDVIPHLPEPERTVAAKTLADSVAALAEMDGPDQSAASLIRPSDLRTDTESWLWLGKPLHLFHASIVGATARGGRRGWGWEVSPLGVLSKPWSFWPLDFVLSYRELYGLHGSGSVSRGPLLTLGVYPLLWSPGCDDDSCLMIAQRVELSGEHDWAFDHSNLLTYQQNSLRAGTGLDLDFGFGAAPLNGSRVHLTTGFHVEYAMLRSSTAPVWDFSVPLRLAIP